MSITSKISSVHNYQGLLFQVWLTRAFLNAFVSYFLCCRRFAIFRLPFFEKFPLLSHEKKSCWMNWKFIAIVIISLFPLIFNQHLLNVLYLMMVELSTLLIRTTRIIFSFIDFYATQPHINWHEFMSFYSNSRGAIASKKSFCVVTLSGLL